MTAFLSLVLEHADLPWVLAGHGYDVGVDSREGSGDESGDGGLSTLWLVALGGLAVATVAILVALDPAGAKARLGRHAPKAAILVVIAAPLIAWTATSGSDDERLAVERWTNADGDPELVVSLRDQGLNDLKTTSGKGTVRLECLDGDDEPVLDAEQEWPFPAEQGYEYPHAHQAASAEQIVQVERCRLDGTSVRLEADVEGVLSD